MAATFSANGIRYRMETENPDRIRVEITGHTGAGVWSLTLTEALKLAGQLTTQGAAIADD